MHVCFLVVVVVVVDRYVCRIEAMISRFVQMEELFTHEHICKARLASGENYEAMIMNLVISSHCSQARVNMICFGQQQLPLLAAFLPKAATVAHQRGRPNAQSNIWVDGSLTLGAGQGS